MTVVFHIVYLAPCVINFSLSLWIRDNSAIIFNTMIQAAILVNWGNINPSDGRAVVYFDIEAATYCGAWLFSAL